jgi:hypothetical protein
MADDHPALQTMRFLGTQPGITLPHPEGITRRDFARSVASMLEDLSTLEYEAPPRPALSRSACIWLEALALEFEPDFPANLRPELVLRARWASRHPTEAHASEAEPGPFDDVSTAHPAYATVTWLRSEGLSDDRGDLEFDGGSDLTRYDYAFATYNLTRCAFPRLPQGVVGMCGTGMAGPEIWMAPVTSAARRLTSRLAWELRIGVRPDRAIWLRALVNEFTPELRTLGANVAGIRGELRREIGRSVNSGETLP